jgi:formylglycine-generating enzyme required for sulfatase activity
MKNSTGWFYGLVGLLAAVSALVFTGCPTESEEKTYTAKPPAVTGVTVTAAGERVVKGESLQFSAAVAGENSPAQTVTWSVVTSGTATGTSISEAGLLTVATGETQTSIEVKATSTVDASKSGTKSVTVSLIPMVSIAGGTFQMGQEDISDATPVHSVTVSDFNMGKYEVTQAEYEAVMGTNPSNFSGDNLPVEQVSWYDAIVFCNKLSMRESLTPAYTISGSANPADWGTVPTSNDSTWDAVTVDWNANGYRLPTEAEWEYACRAGTTTAHNTGDTITDNTGWYGGNSGNTTHPVGGKSANDWGLYDMHGNVWEWCWDWYGDYSSGAQTDPHGPSAGSFRVYRGGAWQFNALLESARRIYVNPSNGYDNLGFRLVRP